MHEAREHDHLALGQIDRTGMGRSDDSLVSYMSVEGRKVRDLLFCGAFHANADMARDLAATGKLKGWKMYKPLNGALGVLGLAAATLALSGPASADGVQVGVHVGPIGVGVGVGDVAYGYRDGYWDRDHRWHEWRDHREMREYRDAHRDRYYDYRHDRHGHDGWRG